MTPIAPVPSPDEYLPSSNAMVEEILRLRNSKMPLNEGLYNLARTFKSDLPPPSELLSIQKQRDCLLTQDAENLRKLVEQERALDEQRQFYNLAISPNEITQWSQLDAWTKEEAVALLLGRDPALVSWSKIKARLDQSSFVRQYQRLLQLVERADCLQGDRLSPKTVLTWGREQHGLEPPEQLVDLVETRARPAVASPQAVSLAAPNPIAEPASCTPVRWTPEKIEELRIYVQKFDTRAAAKKYGVTPTRIRQVLKIGRTNVPNSIFAMGKIQTK